MNMQNWQAALEVVVSRTKHERYRWLCSSANPRRRGYRRLMVDLAAEEGPSPLGDRVGCCGRAEVEAQSIEVKPEWSDDPAPGVTGSA